MNYLMNYLINYLMNYLINYLMNCVTETSHQETLECIHAVYEGDETKGSKSIN